MMQLTARQAELADAGLRLLARGGQAAVTFRAIAAESGWSLGAVQKAFTTKDQILAAMFVRLRSTSVTMPDSPPGRPTLVGWLIELWTAILPLDEKRRQQTLQGSAFAEQAAHDPGAGGALANSDHEVRSQLAGLVRRAQNEGEISAEVDPDDFAWSFLALAQGTATQLLYDPVDEDLIRRRGAAAIARLLAQ